MKIFHKCTLCSKEFDNKKSMTNHRRWHTEDKRYKKYQDSFRRKISQSKIGDKNSQWKGDKAGMVALHARLRRRFKAPELCMNCNKAKVHDLANISGKYKSDISDWKWLCRRCHMVEDGRLEKFKMLNYNR